METWTNKEPNLQNYDHLKHFSAIQQPGIVSKGRLKGGICLLFHKNLYNLVAEIGGTGNWLAVILQELTKYK